MLAVCPSREELRSFTLGDLPEASCEQIASHLEECEVCEETVTHLEHDAGTVLAAGRAAVATDFADEPQYLWAFRQVESLALAAPEARTPARQNASAGPMSESALAAPTPLTPAAQSPRISASEKEDAAAACYPMRLGDYELLEKLGEGGMGTVYKARQVRLDKIVALKVLSAQRTNDPAALSRFEREMKAVGRVSHPNIIQALDAREIDGTTVLVMEYAAGLDLAEVARRLGPLPVADACEIIRQVALGLQAIREYGLVHRDIKPSNLMLASLRSPSGRGAEGDGGEGAVKILDLGLALLQSASLPSEQGSEVTTSGQIMGTSDYMAPEQATDSHHIDIRADIYSLGCTLYRLLAGRAPFSGKEYDTPLKKVMAQVSRPVPAIAQFRPDLPKELLAVIDRCLAKTPEKRFATPAEVSAAMLPFVAGSDLAELLRKAGAAASKDPTAAIGATGLHASSAFVDTAPAGTMPRPRSLWQRVQVRTITLALGLAGVLFFGIVLKMRTSDGTLEVEVSDPAATVEVLNEKGMMIIHWDKPAGKEKIELSVPPGKGEIHVKYGDAEIVTKEFSLASRRTQVITARLVKEPVPPGAATATITEDPWTPWKEKPEAGSKFSLGDKRDDVRRRWRGIADEYFRLIQLQPQESETGIRAASALLFIGDRDRYRLTCKAMLRQFRDTQDPFDADRTAKAGLIGDELPDDRAQFARLAEVADNKGQDIPAYVYFRLTRGLAAYRLGRFEEALHLLDRSGLNPSRRAQLDRSPECQALYDVLTAMALCRTGRASEARRILATVIPAVNANFALDTDPGPRHDWLLCRILADEAEGLLADVAKKPRENAKR